MLGYYEKLSVICFDFDECGASSAVLQSASFKAGGQRDRLHRTPPARPTPPPRAPAPRSQDLTCFDVRCPLATMQNSWLAREVASSPSLSLC